MIFRPALSNVFKPTNMEPTPTARPKQKKPKDDSPDIKRSPVDLCGHCGKNCRDKVLNKAIQCDLYAAWVHASCEGVSSDDYKLMKNLTSSSKNVIYYCSLNQCLSRVKQIVFLTQLLMHHLIFLVPLVNTWIETDENQISLYMVCLRHLP